MKKIGIAGTLLLFLVCYMSFSVSALSIRGDVLWNDEPMKFLLVFDGNRYGLKIERNQSPALRVSADMETGKILIIDDVMQQYATAESKQLVALTALFSLGKIFGVEESWLQGGPVNFFQTGEKKIFEPFGECFQLRVNDQVSGIYWSMQPDNLMTTLINPFLQKVIHDGIRFPFWESIMKMKGFVIANQKDDQSVYRLIEVGNESLDWEKDMQYGDYDQREWMDFLAPFRVER